MPMDELIDLLDTKGNLTGKTAMKSIAHKNGWFHQTVHIWLYTLEGNILVQQRARNKETYPLFWDVSVAGHIGAGEEIERSAVRETAEEIGYSISKSELKKIGVFKSVHKHNKDLIDCEYHHTYLCELKAPFESLKKQDSEVEAFELISLDQFSIEIRDNIYSKKYVPHALSYYELIIKAVGKCI